MAKRTKTQKRRVALDMNVKSRILFFEGLISANDTEVVGRIVNKALKKLGYN